MSNVEETTFIYALIDPRDGIIKYVGKSNDPKERLRGHLKDCKSTVTLKNRWVAKLKSLDLKPTIQILEEVSKAQKGKVVSKETRKRMSEARIASNWVPSPEMIAIQRQECSGEGNGRAKLSESDVRAIRKECAKGDVSISHLSRQYNVDWATIKRIMIRKTWKTVE